MNGVLLVGPTGSGKTPLGGVLVERGLWGRKCAHFDFGDSLRRVADGRLKCSLLSEEDVAIVSRVLQRGALLEASQFHIAKGVLQGFVDTLAGQKVDLIVLNGMPRHLNQAKRVEEIVSVELVVQLVCDGETVRSRIEGNAGGDRTERRDDSMGEVTKKLMIYKDRTMPMVEHYRKNGVRLVVLDVDSEMSAGEMWRELEQRRAK